MSTSINVYAVSVEKLQQLVGSNDLAKAAEICREQEYKLSYDPDDDDVKISCADALVELVKGEVTHPYAGFMYGYAFEAICCSLGKELFNFCPIVGYDFIPDVDQVLVVKSIPLSLMDLISRGSPVPIPPPDDFPGIGFWSAEEIANAVGIVEAADTSGLDDDMSETLEQIGGWVLDTAALPGHSLIGFHE